MVRLNKLTVTSESYLGFTAEDLWSILIALNAIKSFEICPVARAKLINKYCKIIK